MTKAQAGTCTERHREEGEGLLLQYHSSWDKDYFYVIFNSNTISTSTELI